MGKATKRIKHFCEITTVHGLYFVASIKNSYMKTIWAFVVFVGFVGLSLHLYQITAAYLEYRTTEYSYESEDGYYFPDVTICNLNGLSASNMERIADHNEHVRAFLDLSNGTKNPDSNDIPRRTDLFWSLGNEAYDVGHSFDDFIIRCRFAGQPCKREYFKLFQFARFFNCYTFIKGRLGEKSKTEGIAASLSMTIYMEPTNPDTIKEYNDNIIVDNNDGVRMLLTAPNALAAVGVKGYDIRAGLSTSVGFDIIEYTRLPLPYSTCRGVDSMPLEGHFTYSFTECKNLCIHRHLIKECGCIPTRYVVRKNYTDLNMKSCGHYLFSNKTISDQQLKCQARILSNIETVINFANDCNCHLPCEDVRYPITISHSEFPAQDSISSFWKVVLEDAPERENLKAYQYYQGLLSKNTSKDELQRWTQKQFLRLNIFANSKTIVVKEQTPLYSGSDLMSSIGGCLGLWLGVSIVTVVEIIDLGFQLMYVLIKKVQDLSRIETGNSTGSTESTTTGSTKI